MSKSGDDVGDHCVTVLDPLAPRGQSQVFVEWLVRVICVIQEGVGIVNVICSNNTIRIFLSCQETL